MSDVIAVPATGDTFPDLPVVDASGQSSRLAERARAPEGAVVFFMRSSRCPVCLAHVRTLQKMSESGELRGARAIVVTPGGGAQVSAVKRSTALDVFGSGDRHRDVGLRQFLTLQHSGTFVLDSAGAVLASRASALPVSSFSKREIRETLG